MVQDAILSALMICSIVRGAASSFNNSPSFMSHIYWEITSSHLLHFLHRLQNKEKPMQNNFEAPVWLLKMVFECSIAWCDLGLGRAIVHCQRNHLRKPKFSRNRAILSAHFSGVKFYNGFFLDRLFLVLHRLFFSTVRCSWRSSFLEVSDNPHLSLRYPHLSPKIHPQIG